MYKKFGYFWGKHVSFYRAASSLLTSSSSRENSSSAKADILKKADKNLADSYWFFHQVFLSTILTLFYAWVDFKTSIFIKL